MDDLVPFIDETGEERRCGSLENDPNAVSAFPDYSTVLTPYDDKDIRTLITMSDRVPSRVTFGSSWTQNQKSHGSCNGYLCAQLMAKGRWLRGIKDNVLFSGAYCYSKMNGHRDAGSNVEQGMKVLCEQGCPPESLVPWDQIYPELQPKNANEVAAKNKGYNPMRTANMQQVRTALAQQIPVGVVVHAGKKFQSVNKTTGIGGFDNGPGNHAVVADDLVLIGGHEYADVHNQWGNSFGINGRTYLPLEAFLQTMQNHWFYIIMNTLSV